MRKYLFQRFLPDCDTSQINLPDLYASKVDSEQVISVSLLDEKIDTEADLQNLLNAYDPNIPVVLSDDRPSFQNQILVAYAEKTLKSYLYWFTAYGYSCFWTKATAA